MADEGQEKTFDASEKKISDAAEKGQIVKSQEISSLAVLASGAGALIFLSGPMVKALGDLMRWCYDVSGPQTLDHDGAMTLGAEVMRQSLTALAAPLGTICVAVIAVGLGQSRFRMAWKALEPKPERLDPIDGFKNKFMNWTPLVELVKGVSKLAALGGVVWFAIRGELETLPAMAALHPADQLEVMVGLAWDVVVGAAPLIIGIAALDYGYNWWKLHDDLKMSHQEVKEERKQMDGDPHMKAARRQRARQIALGQAIAAVAKADLVITNPTHYAVALRYRKDEAPAPIIVCMGVDHMALKIRAKAREHEIIQIENRPLARALHAKGTVGHIIPEELFGAVAKVLAVVYRRRGRR